MSTYAEQAKNLPECPRCYVPAGIECVTGRSIELEPRAPHDERLTLRHRDYMMSRRREYNPNSDKPMCQGGPRWF